MTRSGPRLALDRQRAAAAAATIAVGLRIDQELAAMMRRFSTQGVLVGLLRRGGRVAIPQVEVVDADLRGRGLARGALKQVCEWADRGGHTLAVSPSAQWGADLGRLERLYESLGFEVNQPTGEIQYADKMIRYPVVRSPA